MAKLPPLPSLLAALPLLCLLLLAAPRNADGTIHELLKKHGLPGGLLPRGVESYTLDEASGLLEAKLSAPCYAKYDDGDLAYFDTVVRGNLSYGALRGVEGLSQEELFVWLPVKGIMVADPRSGVILFDIGYAHKRLSRSLFEEPPDCRPSAAGGMGAAEAARWKDWKAAIERWKAGAANANTARTRLHCRERVEPRMVSQTRTQDAASSSSQSSKSQSETAESRLASKRGSKKKGVKAISLAEAAKGSIVFKQGKPCSCQARQHSLVSNCLSCGKIVCEQEGEGPCSFCGALVLMEGSTYAGLSDIGFPLSETEAAAEAYAKRLVDYDRNSAARTKVYDDQSDYYEMEGNSWLSSKEKSVLKKQQEEAQEAAESQKGKVIVTFDLVGRKVILNKDGATELESEHPIFRPSEEKDQSHRIQPNPTIREQPVFIETGPVKLKTDRAKQSKRLAKNGLCLEVTGRLQHDDKDLQGILSGKMKKGDHLAYSSFGQACEGDDYECSQDFD